MTVLVNAYACSPKWGSELGIGWHWSIELARYCKVIVITEGEFRDEIEEALKTLPQKNNLQFIFNNVTDKVRRMCWNQGDWRFYWYYRKWQEKTLKIAEKICSENQIDIIHQLNMQGFREPGLLWKIKGPRFVWGPVGGMSMIPVNYLKSESLKRRLFYHLKNIINRLQYTYQPNVRKAVERADVILASTPDTRKIFCDVYHRDAIFVNDTGCGNEKVVHSWTKTEENVLDIIWVAKFDVRKQLAIAIKTIYLLKDLNIKFNIVGTGKDEAKYRKLANDLCVSDKCHFWGKIENKKVLEMMRLSDLFFFTSIHEATSTVILEAIGAGLPIVCFDTCGFGPIVDDSIGRKIKISTPEQSARDFANVIRYLYLHRELLPRMSENCVMKQEFLSWEYKVKHMVDIYKKIM